MDGAGSARRREVQKFGGFYCDARKPDLELLCFFSVFFYLARDSCAFLAFHKCPNGWHSGVDVLNTIFPFYGAKVDHLALFSDTVSCYFLLLQPNASPFIFFKVLFFAYSAHQGRALRRGSTGLVAVFFFSFGFHQITGCRMMGQHFCKNSPGNQSLDDVPS